jgi:hypothetical protein
MHRRLASRALRVLNRHKETQPAIGAYENTLSVSAAQFIAHYDKARAFEATRAKSMKGGKGATRELLMKLRGWTALVQKYIDGFDRSTYGDKHEVPDDVISDAENFLLILDEHNSTEETPLAVTDALKADLEAALEAARAEWFGAGDASSEQESLRKMVRDSGETFQGDLVSFRQTLRAFLGKTHVDYRKLRVLRATVEDEDDDAVARDLPDDNELDLVDVGGGGDEEVLEEAS